VHLANNDQKHAGCRKARQHVLAFLDERGIVHGDQPAIIGAALECDLAQRFAGDRLSG